MPYTPSNPVGDFRFVEILLVDDDPGDVLLTREAFAEGKVANRLHFAEDGEKALAFLRREGGFADAPAVDIILLDLNLPRKDGHEVLAELKADPRLAGIPVVIVTGNLFEGEILKAYNLDVNCYITKPIDIAQFMKVVRFIPEFQVAIVTNRPISEAHV
jgi:CheY-like chemotaxis protein